MRGEHRPRPPADVNALGPSPRARGALHHRRQRRHRRGTIPACAGSTRQLLSVDHMMGDHPRVRGEHDETTGEQRVRPGPSPRARGARPGGRGGSQAWGTIPACAGSTGFRDDFGTVQMDHPRVRGEHVAAIAGIAWVRGPSPRARGAPQAPQEVGVLLGTIPACAGSTPTAGGGRHPAWDHPRVRGEHPPMTWFKVDDSGPSPRARGALWLTCGFVRGEPRFRALLRIRTFSDSAIGWFWSEDYLCDTTPVLHVLESRDKTLVPSVGPNALRGSS